MHPSARSGRIKQVFGQVPHPVRAHQHIVHRPNVNVSRTCCAYPLRDAHPGAAPSTRGVLRATLWRRNFGDNQLTGTLPVYFNGLVNMDFVGMQNNLLTGAAGGAGRRAASTSAVCPTCVPARARVCRQAAPRLGQAGLHNQQRVQQHPGPHEAVSLLAASFAAAARPDCAWPDHACTRLFPPHTACCTATA